MAQTHETCSASQVPHPAREWNTNSVGEAEAFDYYRESICTAFMPLRPELDAPKRAAFQAVVCSHQTDSGVLNIVSARAHRVQRGKAEIASSPQDCYYLNTQLHGECRVAQRGTAMTLRVGDVGIFDGSEPFDLKHDYCRSLGVASLMVPKRLLQDAAGPEFGSGPSLLSGHPVVGNLISEAGRALATASSGGCPDALSRLSQVFLSLAVLATGSSTPLVSPVGRRLARLHQIRQIIHQNCARPDFDLSECASLIGLSVGYVQQILAGNGTRFGALLLETRLAQAARSLLDPAQNHLSVSSIAYAAGFKDVSHFGRAFRQEYDQSPGQWRRQAAAVPPR